MSLRYRLNQLNAALAERDADTGVQILHAIAAEGHPDVAKTLRAEIIAAAARAADKKR